MKKFRRHTPIVYLIFTTLLVSCSTQKNNSASRFYQGLTTRFNVYFNGQISFDKASNTQLQNVNENYTQFLPIHPISNAKGQTNGDFDRTIDKCQKAIKSHSIKTKPTFNGIKGTPQYQKWLQTEEYNPYLHHAWLLLAQAQFYKGDFMAASSTYGYIVRHFRNLPQVVLEAQIWGARCLAELNWLYEAEDALHKIKPADLNLANKTLWNLTNADILLKQGQADQSLPFLRQSIADETNKIQKYRHYFLLGQIYQQNGNLDEAYKAYNEVIRLSPPYETEFTARIRQTECVGKENTTNVLRKLISLTKKSKNKEYLDQLHYAIGNIYLNKKDTNEAVKNYIISIKKSEKNVNQKALTQIKLGDLYFNMHKYQEAQPCYSEAISVIGKEHPDYSRLSKRSDALDELITHYQNVHLQDSLLYLSSLPENEKLDAVKRIIAQIEEKEAAEKKALEKERMLMEQAERQEGQPNAFNNTRIKSPSMPNVNGDKSWYFYNTASITKGKTDFLSRWGSRKLEDNWRRRNKNSFNFDNISEKNSGDTKNDASIKDTTVTAKVSDPKQPQFYLQQLPSTKEEITNANEIINDGLYNMALVYKNRLEDFPLALTTFNELLKRYPDSKNRVDIYYNTYLIGEQSGNSALSNQYKTKLITEFPDNKYSIALSDPNFIQNYLNKKNEVEILYQKTYEEFQKNNLKTVVANYDYVKEKHPLSKLLPKFAFLNALCLLSDKKTDEFKKALAEILTKYPDADISSLAGSMMQNLAQGKQLSGQSVSSNIWNSKISSKSIDTTNPTDKLVEFTVDKLSPHFMLFVFPEDSTYNNQLLYEVAGFNFTNFAIRDFDFDMFPLQGIGMLRVKGFASYEEVEIYRTRLFGEKGIANKLPKNLRTVLISEKNFESLLKGRTFEEYFSFFDKNFPKK